MATKFAALNSYPRFGIPPRLSGLPAFQLAPRHNRRLSLPRIEVLVEPDDSDDECPLFSYHSMRLKAYERARAPSPDDVDDLEKKGLVSPESHDTPVAKKKPTDTTNKWDYYVAPLSPLSDLTESDTSDSDDDDQSNPAETLADGSATIPRSNARVPGPAKDLLPPSSSGLKRKRSCDSGATLTSPASAIKDSGGPSAKRARRMSGTLEQSSETELATASLHARESKKNFRRQGMMFGTVRKPRVVGVRQKGARTENITPLINQ